MAQADIRYIWHRAATAIGMAVVALAVLLPLSARAGFTTSQTLTSGSLGMPLTSGVVYRVENDLSLQSRIMLARTGSYEDLPSNMIRR